MEMYGITFLHSICHGEQFGPSFHCSSPCGSGQPAAVCENCCCGEEHALTCHVNNEHQTYSEHEDSVHTKPILGGELIDHWPRDPSRTHMSLPKLFHNTLTVSSDSTSRPEMKERIWGGMIAGAMAAFHLWGCQWSMADVRSTARQTKLLMVAGESSASPGVSHSDLYKDCSVDMVSSQEEERPYGPRKPARHSRHWHVLQDCTYNCSIMSMCPLPPLGARVGELSHMWIPSYF